MNGAYGALAGHYDELTRDVAYGRLADHCERIFSSDAGSFHLLLDLCCGTGSLTLELARRGYEMIGADASADMLMEAMDKAARLRSRRAPAVHQPGGGGARPLRHGRRGGVLAGQPQLCASGGAAGGFPPAAAVLRPEGCCYLTCGRRDSCARWTGSVSVDETEDVFCLWRGRFDSELGALRYGMDIFEREGALWRALRGGARRIRPRAGYARLLAGEEGFTDISVSKDGL